MDEIEINMFDPTKGLIPSSIRDMGKYQGHRRFHNKSRDQYYHVGLIFLRITNPVNAQVDFEGDLNSIFSKLDKKITMRLTRVDKDSLGKKDLAKFYSCAHLCVPKNTNMPALITVAIVFRNPAPI
jgi:hypothetical protein